MKGTNFHIQPLKAFFTRAKSVGVIEYPRWTVCIQILTRIDLDRKSLGFYWCTVNNNFSTYQQFFK